MARPQRYNVLYNNQLCLLTILAAKVRSAVDKPLKTGVETVHIGPVSLDGVDTHALIERRHGEEVGPCLRVCLKTGKDIVSNDEAMLRHVGQYGSSGRLH